MDHPASRPTVVEEDQTTYNDAKPCRNTVRAYASNDLDQDDEPEDDSRTSITGEEFLRLTRRLFAGDKHADVLACLKRTVDFSLRAQSCVPAVAKSRCCCEGASHQGRSKICWQRRTSLCIPNTSLALWNMAQTGKTRWPKRCAWFPKAWPSLNPGGQKSTLRLWMRRQRSNCTHHLPSARLPREKAQNQITDRDVFTVRVIKENALIDTTNLMPTIV